MVIKRKFGLGTQNIYTADVVSYSDYSPYGTLLDGRHGEQNNADYRFGYQGSEKDDEIKNISGSSYTTFYRMLDPRIGRWLSTDPVFQPWQSPYTSMDNSPIALNDPLGNETDDWGRKGNQWFWKDGITADNFHTMGYEEYAAPGHIYSHNDEWAVVLGAKRGEWWMTKKDEWAQDFGVLYNKNGLPVQESYALMTELQKQRHARNVANGNALDNLFLSMVAGAAVTPLAPLVVTGATVATTAVIETATFLASSTTVVGTTGSLVTTTQAATIFGGSGVGLGTWWTLENYVATSTANAAIDATTQITINGFENWDVWDTGSKFLPELYDNSSGALVDYTPFQAKDEDKPAFRVVGSGKSFGDTGRDLFMNYTFGSQGLSGEPGRKIKYGMDKLGTPQFTPVLTMPFNLGNEIMKDTIKKSMQSNGL